MYSAHLSSRPGWASFFSDWNTMYIETMLAPPDFRHFERLIVNVENGLLIGASTHGCRKTRSSSTSR